MLLIKKKDDAIELQLHISPSRLHFRSRNTFNKEAIVNHENGGMGTAYVKRRLDLTYKDQYDLKIKSNESHFQVSLQIELT